MLAKGNSIVYPGAAGKNALLRKSNARCEILDSRDMSAVMIRSLD